MFGACLPIAEGPRPEPERAGRCGGTFPKAICTIERGNRSTTIEKLVELARFFQGSADCLLGLKDTKD